MRERSYFGMLLGWYDDFSDSPDWLLVVDIHVLSVTAGRPTTSLDSTDLYNNIISNFLTRLKVTQSSLSY